MSCGRLYGCDMCFFFQAEDGIRYLVRSRGLGDVYKRQALDGDDESVVRGQQRAGAVVQLARRIAGRDVQRLSLIHI